MVRRGCQRWSRLARSNRRANREAAIHAVRPVGLDPENLTARIEKLDRRGHTCAQAASADWHDDGIERGQLLAELEPQSRCAERSRPPFERMDQCPSLFTDDGLHTPESSVGIRRELDLRSVRSAQLDTQGVGARDHDHLGTRADLLRSESHRDGMVACTATSPRRRASSDNASTFNKAARTLNVPVS